MRVLQFSCSIMLTVLLSVVAQAEEIQFDLMGAGGEGLLESNIDPPTGEQGTGGEGITGIFFDTITSELSIHVEWGSSFGYEDLSEDVFRLHLHGPTADPAPFNFGQTAPLLINLTNSTSFVASRTGGGVNDRFFIDSGDVTGLLEGRMYLNVHLSDSDTGVIRGYLVQSIPEPVGATVFATLLLVGRRRRR